MWWAGRGAAGQFKGAWGVSVVRGLLLVTEDTRLQVLTPKGVPLQVLTLGDGASAGSAPTSSACGLPTRTGTECSR